MVSTPTATLVAARPGKSFPPVVALLSLGLLGAPADVEAQAPDRVRLLLLEMSAAADSASCALEVVVGTTAGEAILTCHRNTPPVSQLGAHRALTTSEAARLYALVSRPEFAQRPPAGSSAHARVDRPTATITITRGSRRVVLDVTNGSKGLARHERQTWRRLRDLADELRGTPR